MASSAPNTVMASYAKLDEQLDIEAKRPRDAADGPEPTPDSQLMPPPSGPAPKRLALGKPKVKVPEEKAVTITIVQPLLLDEKGRAVRYKETLGKTLMTAPVFPRMHVVASPDGEEPAFVPGMDDRVPDSSTGEDLLRERPGVTTFYMWPYSAVYVYDGEKGMVSAGPMYRPSRNLDELRAELTDMVREGEMTQEEGYVGGYDVYGLIPNVGEEGGVDAVPLGTTQQLNEWRMLRLPPLANNHPPPVLVVPAGLAKEAWLVNGLRDNTQLKGLRATESQVQAWAGEATGIVEEGVDSYEEALRQETEELLPSMFPQSVRPNPKPVYDAMRDMFKGLAELMPDRREQIVALVEPVRDAVRGQGAAVEAAMRQIAEQRAVPAAQELWGRIEAMRSADGAYGEDGSAASASEARREIRRRHSLDRVLDELKRAVRGGDLDLGALDDRRATVNRFSPPPSADAALQGLRFPRWEAGLQVLRKAAALAPEDARERYEALVAKADAAARAVEEGSRADAGYLAALDALGFLGRAVFRRDLRADARPAMPKKVLAAISAFGKAIALREDELRPVAKTLVEEARLSLLDQHGVSGPAAADARYKGDNEAIEQRVLVALTGVLPQGLKGDYAGDLLPDLQERVAADRASSEEATMARAAASVSRTLAAPSTSVVAAKGWNRTSRVITLIHYTAPTAVEAIGFGRADGPSLQELEPIRTSFTFDAANIKTVQALIELLRAANVEAYPGDPSRPVPPKGSDLSNPQNPDSPWHFPIRNAQFLPVRDYLDPKTDPSRYTWGDRGLLHRLRGVAASVNTYATLPDGTQAWDADRTAELEAMKAGLAEVAANAPFKWISYATDLLTTIRKGESVFYVRFPVTYRPATFRTGSTSSRSTIVELPGAKADVDYVSSLEDILEENAPIVPGGSHRAMNLWWYNPSREPSLFVWNGRTKDGDDYEDFPVPFNDLRTAPEFLPIKEAADLAMIASYSGFRALIFYTTYDVDEKTKVQTPAAPPRGRGPLRQRYEAAMAWQEERLGPAPEPIEESDDVANLLDDDEDTSDEAFDPDDDEGSEEGAGDEDDLDDEADLDDEEEAEDEEADETDAEEDDDSMF